MTNVATNREIVSNDGDPDQAQNFVGPDLGLKCLQRLPKKGYKLLKEFASARPSHISPFGAGWKLWMR